MTEVCEGEVREAGGFMSGIQAQLGVTSQFDSGWN